MARRDRMRSKQWHFSYSDGRFNNRKQYRSSIDPSPISTTFNRKIMRCKRCGSRVVSNVSHCPYCGKNLLPFYRRFWFWLVIVALMGVGVAAILFYLPGIQTPQKVQEANLPVVVNAAEGSPFKDLVPGTTIEYNQLQVTVTGSHQAGVSSNGIVITAVEVSFYNSGTTPITLYSTQWQLESEDGTRVDCFIGKTSDDESIHSELETQNLGPSSTYTTVLYFALDNPNRAVFAPNAVSYVELELVTWNIKPAEEPPAPEDEPPTE